MKGAMTMRYFEDVSVGENVGEIRRTPTTRQLVQYAGASGDFYEIHYDQSFAREGGLPGVIVHGLLKAAWLAELVRNWAGEDAFVRSLKATYRGTDEPGHTYVIGGRVASVSEDVGPTGSVILDVWGENERQQKTTLGSAIVSLPRRVASR